LRWILSGNPGALYFFYIEGYLFKLVTYVKLSLPLLSLSYLSILSA